MASGLQTIIGSLPIDIVQPFGRTPWSTGAGASLYGYGRSFCLDGVSHPGIDLGGPYGSPLYSPVAGRVSIVGGAYYQDTRQPGQPATGELAIVTANGTIVILGHMSRIMVKVGSRVYAGQVVGSMGTENGPHVHVEYRVPSRDCAAGYRIVDPVPLLLADVGGGGGSWVDTPPAGGGTVAPGGTGDGVAYPADFAGLAERLDGAARLVPLNKGSVWAGLSQDIRAVAVRGLVVFVGVVCIKQAFKRQFGGGL